MIVYLLKSPPGKVYVGQTKNTFDARWYCHVKDSRGKSKYRLHQAIRKHGENNFSTEILATPSSVEEMNYLESYFIIMFNADNPNYGYNMTRGGEGRSAPTIVSRETRAKIGAANKLWRSINGTTEGQKKAALRNLLAANTPEARAKRSRSLSVSMKGIVFSEERRRNISAGLKGKMLGRKLSEETRHKMSVVRTGKKMPEGFGKSVSERMKGKPKPWLIGHVGWNKGQKTSSEVRSKMSASHREAIRINPSYNSGLFKQGCIAPNKGKPTSAELKKKLSDMYWIRTVAYA